MGTQEDSRARYHEGEERGFTVLIPIYQAAENIRVTASILTFLSADRPNRPTQ